MKHAVRTLVMLMLLAWSSAVIAGDWYVHRTSHVMKEPPWYCYCYRATTANVIPGTPTHPIDMQISEEQAFINLANYAAMPETCPGNCGFGSGGSSRGGKDAAGGPPAPKPKKQPSPACRQLAQVGGCEGMCKGMASGHNVAAKLIAKCIADCNVSKINKFGCAP